MLIVNKEEYEKGSIKFQRSVDICKALIIDLDRIRNDMIEISMEFSRKNISCVDAKIKLAKTLCIFNNTLTKLTQINNKYLSEKIIVPIVEKIISYDAVSVVFYHFIRVL